MRDSASLASRALGQGVVAILPFLGLGYLCSYLDRINVSFAATQMNVDLGFSATVYGLGSGLFFLTYALLEIPSGMVMPRIGARRWIVADHDQLGADFCGHDVRPHSDPILHHAAVARSCRGGLLADLHLLSVQLVSGGSSRACDQPLLLLRRSLEHCRRHALGLAARARRHGRTAWLAMAVPARRRADRAARQWRCSGYCPTGQQLSRWLAEDERDWIVRRACGRELPARRRKRAARRCARCRTHACSTSRPSPA